LQNNNYREEKQMAVREMRADVVILGGGTGGCAAALAAAGAGARVVMTEETDWIGGQLTSQAVPPDEHEWIEKFGCTRSYKRFREGVRDYFRRHLPLTGEAMRDPYLNPGNGWVSPICHPPTIALAVLEAMLAPYTMSRRLTILPEHKPVSAETDVDKVSSVTVQSSRDGESTVISAPYFLDATELGDILPLAGVEYVTGSESSSQTGEPHALDEANPLDMQGITVCFAVDYCPGEDHTIERPRGYDFWRDYKADFWPDKQLSWYTSHVVPGVGTGAKEWSLFPELGKFPLWTYRRLIDKDLFTPGIFESDISLINNPQNDYWLGPIIEVDEAVAKVNLEASRQLSLSFLYWMQTEAPRHDGGQGYPGLRPRGDVVGTDDGLAKYPYIRESRRINAEYTIVEQDLNSDVRSDGGAKVYEDSVGVGGYHVDLHPSTGGRDYVKLDPYPFQIPLGALIPERVENLLPACKNIGTTHLTNGCYRLHPVEWNVGEVAGTLAAHCVREGLNPRQVRNDRELLESFLHVLTSQGVELEWPKPGTFESNTEEYRREHSIPLNLRT
jgi:FAD dependent oxidoreductase